MPFIVFIFPLVGSGHIGAFSGNVNVSMLRRGRQGRARRNRRLEVLFAARRFLFPVTPKWKPTSSVFAGLFSYVYYVYPCAGRTLQNNFVNQTRFCSPTHSPQHATTRSTSLRGVGQFHKPAPCKRGRPNGHACLHGKLDISLWRKMEGCQPPFLEGASLDLSIAVKPVFPLGCSSRTAQQLERKGCPQRKQQPN